MSLRRLAVMAGILAIGSALAYRAGSAAPPAGGAQAESVDVRYARAQLQLAEATLRKALDQNRRVGETISAGLLAQFTDSVHVAKAQLQSAEHPGEADALAGWIRRAESAVREAENRLKRANEVNRLVAGTVAAIDIERLRLSVDIAKLQVERGQSVAKASSEAKLRWQVDMLSDELTRVKSQTGVLLQNRGPTDF
jgi:hypothetical protein